MTSALKYVIDERTSKHIVVAAFSRKIGNHMDINDRNMQPVIDWCSANGVERTSYNRFKFKLRDRDLLTAFALRFGLDAA